MTDNPERDARILELWAKGFSHAMVVSQMGNEGFALTRSLVSGVIHRAGKNRGAPRRPSPLCQPRSTKPRKPKPAPLVISDEPEIIGPVGEFAHSSACQYIKGDVDENFQMCGHPISPGKKYCQWHIDNRIRRLDLRTSEDRQRANAR